jgi:hypothetical protein
MQGFSVAPPLFSMGNTMADDDFSSLFGEETPVPRGADELFSIEEPPVAEPAAPEPSAPSPPREPRSRPAPDGGRRRSFQDFEPDMDALLITAQSSMIIEGMRWLIKRVFSAKSLPVYSEAIKGIDLYIKILERNPDNFRKLGKVIESDIDCSEVFKMAGNIYRSAFNMTPETDDQKLKALEIFREQLALAHQKAQISHSINSIKRFYLQSGSLDEVTIKDLVQRNDPAFKGEISSLTTLLKIALGLIKSGRSEIAAGMKGREVNIYIIRCSELLFRYYHLTGNVRAAEYYKRHHENYKKYFVIR